MNTVKGLAFCPVEVCLGQSFFLTKKFFLKHYFYCHALAGVVAGYGKCNQVIQRVDKVQSYVNTLHGHICGLLIMTPISLSQSWRSIIVQNEIEGLKPVPA